MKTNKEKKKSNNDTHRLDPAKTRYPSPIIEKAQKMEDGKKIELIAERFKEIMEILGLDVSDGSLSRTPYRVAKMYVNEIFSGLKTETFPEVTFIDDPYHKEAKSNIVFMKVQFTSFCEHHFVPMMGNAYIAYLPKGKLIGLSKIPRIVKFFSKRPQLQERLTAQIADSLATLLNTEDVGVSITAQHFCVLAIGIEDPEGHTTTNVFRGEFKEESLARQEFFEAMNRVSNH